MNTKKTLDQPEIRDHIIRQYKRGRSMSDIAKEIGCVHDTIRRALIRWNIPARTRHFRSYTCVDCGRASNGRTRCNRCERVHIAELQRGYDEDRRQAVLTPAQRAERLAYHQEKYRRRLYKLGREPKNKLRVKPNKSYTRKPKPNISLDLNAPIMS